MACSQNAWAMFGALLHPLAWWIATIFGVRTLLGSLGGRRPGGNG